MMDGAAVFRAHYWDCISLQQDGVQLLPVWLVKAQHKLHNPSVSTNNNAVSTSKHGWVGIDTLYLGHTVNYNIPPVSYSRARERERERERARERESERERERESARARERARESVRESERERERERERETVSSHRY